MTNPADLKNIGLKATLPRLKILEIFQHSQVRHLTAEDDKHEQHCDGPCGHPVAYPGGSAFEAI